MAQIADVARALRVYERVYTRTTFEELYFDMEHDQLFFPIPDAPDEFSREDWDELIECGVSIAIDGADYPRDGDVHPSDAEYISSMYMY